MFSSLSGLILSGGSLNHLTSGLMTSVISQGILDMHLEESRSIYKVIGEIMYIL